MYILADIPLVMTSPQNPEVFFAFLIFFFIFMGISGIIFIKTLLQIAQLQLSYQQIEEVNESSYM